VILQVTGSTICGSDLHLYHGSSVVQMQAGDILGHEFCGIVSEIGSGVSKAPCRESAMYVASFQIGLRRLQVLRAKTQQPV
jgi:threonine dehydrogenase-like Zn-dependent dehydrogenase